LLEGSVRKHGGRLRISAQLIAVPDDRHLWSAVFERAVGEVFDARAGRQMVALDHLQHAIDAGYRHFEWIVCEPDLDGQRGGGRS
jgi:TolB-like protein